MAHGLQWYCVMTHSKDAKMKPIFEDILEGWHAAPTGPTAGVLEAHAEMQAELDEALDEALDALGDAFEAEGL